MTRRPWMTIAAIPVALALAMAASSQRLVDRWWPTFPNDRVTNAADGSATLTGVLSDPKGSHPYAVRLALVQTSRVTEVVEAPGGQPQRDVSVPDGLALWRLDFDVALPRTTVLGTCTFDILDREGRHYSPGVDLLDGFASVTTSCAPPGAGGPRPAISADDVTDGSGDDAARPAAYERFVHVVLPEDVEPTSVRVWIETPQYAEFDVRRS